MDEHTIDPIDGVLAILNEGSTTSANKFGLLLALIDLAPTVGPDDRLPLVRVAEKLIEIYWDHVRPFGPAGAPLRQVSSGNRDNAKVVLIVEALHATTHGALTYEQARLMAPDAAWDAARRQVIAATKKNALRYLQILPGSSVDFLYSLTPGNDAITFEPGVVRSLTRFSGALRPLIEFRFVRFVASINSAALGHPIEGQLHEHLFGQRRHMPPPALRAALADLQGKRCVYTGLPLPTGSAGLSVDHVVPWSRARLSTIENFCITSRSVNSKKAQHLLAPSRMVAWIDYVTGNHDELRGLAQAHGWPHDLSRVFATAAALYRSAADPTPTWDGTQVLAVGRNELEWLAALLEEAVPDGAVESSA